MCQHIKGPVYEAPCSEVIAIIQEENFLESPGGDTPVTQSDRGMESYRPGEVW